MFIAINPALGEEIRRIPLDSPERVQLKTAAVHDAWQQWARSAPGMRSERLLCLAGLLEEQREVSARLMAEEMGKPIIQGRAEVDKCAWLCRYVAETGPAQLTPEQVALDAAQASIVFAPQGLILGIMPWNFPFWQVFRFAVPTLMDGNGVLIKHAPNVPGCAESISHLFHEAGITACEHLYIAAESSEDVIADVRIRGVSLTGSRRAGRAVAALAGRYLKKSVMELGGSDPYLILDDADVELAAQRCVAGRLLNSGQTCIAAKRWIVLDGIYDAFRAAVVDILREANVGDPLDERTTVGPMARDDLRQNLHAQVESSLRSGARVVMGGEIPQGKGFYYPVTLLESVSPGMPAFDEELFGPVACLIHAENEYEAIRLANATIYGLGGGVFSGDTCRARRVADAMDIGAVAINDFVKSDPRLPFGGVKESGYGLELAAYGLREFVNTKTIVLPD